MNIAYLAWGSLVWDPRYLPVRRTWFNDGPLLSVEFCRQSQDNRITLVIAPGRPKVRVLWGLSSAESIDAAVEALRAREDVLTKNRDCHIGRWCAGSPEDDVEPEVVRWAARMGLDAVVWTALPPKFKGKDEVVPSVEEVVGHLSNLPAEKRRNAETYVRRTPVQIDTDYRRQIESKLGWTPLV